jgi:DNA-binding IclR family transcriptional regulator
VCDHLGTAVAALTIPFLDLVSRDEAMGQRSVAAALEQAAQRISQAIGGSEG